VTSTTTFYQTTTSISVQPASTVTSTLLALTVTSTLPASTLPQQTFTVVSTYITTFPASTQYITSTLPQQTTTLTSTFNETDTTTQTQTSEFPSNRHSPHQASALSQFRWRIGQRFGLRSQWLYLPYVHSTDSIMCGGHELAIALESGTVGLD
jgi:hypothetical protein